MIILGKRKRHNKIFATIKYDGSRPIAVWIWETHIFRVTDDKIIIHSIIPNFIHKLHIDKDTIKAWYDTVYVDREVIIECTPSTLAFTSL